MTIMVGSNDTVLVLGATGGIGSAVADALLARGARVPAQQIRRQRAIGATKGGSNGCRVMP
jgi:nucleoside-diphosphate-sugar epimerase